MKNTTKKIKPAFVVDITQCYSYLSTLAELAVVKVEAKLPISTKELSAVILMTVRETRNMCRKEAELKDMIDSFIKDIEEAFKPEPKKPNMFKRFWNWITRKNK